MTAEILPHNDVAEAGHEPAPRLVAKKLSLRVSGTRVGSVTRPVEAGPAAAGPRPRMLGLRVHASALAPRPAATSTGPEGPGDGPGDGPAWEGYAWDDGGRP